MPKIAQHKENLRVILNLGEGAIRDGESVDSVKKQLMVLGRQISAVRPKSERELTKVLIPLSLTSKDGQGSAWLVCLALKLNPGQVDSA